MTLFMIFINLNILSIFLILIYCTYLDLKQGIIPNTFLKRCFIYGLFLNSIEIIFYLNSFILYIILRFLAVSIIFIISFILFDRKIIYGGDCKLIILLFFILPVKYLFYFLLFFYYYFFLFFCLMILINIIFNSISKNRVCYNILFNLNDITKLRKKINIIGFSKIINAADPHSWTNEHISENSDLIYNDQKKAFQVIVYKMYARMIPILLSFCFISLLILIRVI